MPKDIKEIEYKKNNRLGWIAFSVLVIHFGLVLFSIFPASSFTAPLKQLGQEYTDPIFKQTWAMFAPCPVLENRLKVKYYFENDSSEWVDPVAEVLVKHQSYRFTYHGNIAVGYYNMLYWFKNAIDRHKTSNNQLIFYNELKKIANKKELKAITNYVSGLAVNHNKSAANDLLFYGKLSNLRNSQENRLLYNYVKGYAHDRYRKKPIKTSLRLYYINKETNITEYYYISDYK